MDGPAGVRLPRSPASLLAVVFGLIELRRRHPLLDVRLFLDPDFGTGAAAITMVFLGTFALFYLVTQFVQQVMGYTPLATAIALAPLAVPLLTFSSLSSWYLPKLGLRPWCSRAWSWCRSGSSACARYDPTRHISTCCGRCW